MPTESSYQAQLRWWRRGTVVATAAAVGFAALAFIPHGAGQISAPGGEPAGKPAAVVSSGTAPARVLDAAPVPTSFASLVEKVKPAVVNVSTTQKLAARGPGMMSPGAPFPPGSPFDQFFRHFFQNPGPNGGGGGGGEGGDQPGPEVHALGSGFIIDPSGLIVTNNHVVDGATEITVALDDGTRFPAKVKGRDPKTDLALLQIDAKKPLPSVTWGDSNSARVGDWVIAVGDPFGLGGTVTQGIISARSRNIQEGPYDDFLQVDAPINKGNSGGPTFNLAGEVIGINTAIFSPSGGSVGIGFAIPSAMAKQVVAQLREYGSVHRGMIGVVVQQITPEVAQALEMDRPHGALVRAVTPGGPADKAGIKPGDVITAFNGTEINDYHALPILVAAAKDGDTAKVQILRQGKEETVKVTITKYKEDQTASAESDNGEGGGAAEQSSVLGLNLSKLTAEVREQYHLTKDVHGVAVIDVAENVQGAGIQPGDVIQSIDQKEVNSPADVKKAVEKAKSAGRKVVLLLISRGGQPQFVPMPVG